jgi:uncharacterized repeat protein (TIGR03803 family)
MRMKIPACRLCFFTLISLSFFPFATHTGMQGYIFNQLLGPTKVLLRTGRIHNATTAGAASAYTYSVLYSFCSSANCTDGEFPQAGLIQDAAGNLYGTTTAGGGNSNSFCGSNGCGTVFKVDNTGHETVLYSFCSAANCTDGAVPQAGLIQDGAGNLYGTTAGGGNFYNFCPSNGCGTVFKVDNTGHESVLYTFCSTTVMGSPCLDGDDPKAGLIQDAAGNLYGTTYYGGANNGGTLFKVDSSGHETVLKIFCSFGSNCVDGTDPQAGLIQDAAGNLYGTTLNGGSSYYTVGPGAVFKLNNAGYTVLYSFCPESSCSDGANPYAGLIQDSAGNLYGTTFGGGTGVAIQCCGGGTVFKVDTTGKETVLYSFCSSTNCTDGEFPQAGLIQDAAGNLYGTTTAGGGNSNSFCGSNGCGTVFKLDNTGHETALYSFCSAANCMDGAVPQAGLIQDGAGNLYGTTGVGGANGNGGTVFKIIPPSLNITGTAVEVSRGATTTSTITVTPGGGFTGSVALTAAVTSSPAGAQDLPMLSFGSTNPVSISGASAGTATLTITTTAASNASLAYPARRGVGWYSVGVTGLALVLLVGIPPRARTVQTRLSILIFLMIFIGGFVACGGSGGVGGSGNPGTTPGVYTVTVTGTSGSATANGTVTLTVQ